MVAVDLTLCWICPESSCIEQMAEKKLKKKTQCRRYSFASTIPQSQTVNTKIFTSFSKKVQSSGIPSKICIFPWCKWCRKIPRVFCFTSVFFRSRNHQDGKPWHFWGHSRGCPKTMANGTCRGLGTHQAAKIASLHRMSTSYVVFLSTETSSKCEIKKSASKLKVHGKNTLSLLDYPIICWDSVDSDFSSSKKLLKLVRK